MTRAGPAPGASLRIDRGRRAHPVLDLLFARAEAGSRPGERTDGCKLGLAMEGGGMRGVVSAGMACAIERLGLLEAFDAVYGTSAGAVNGAFLVAGQGRYGIPLYWEDINNRRFIHRLRLFSARPVIALEFLLDHVMTRRKILDWWAVLAAPVPLKAAAVALDSLEAVLLAGFRSRDELFGSLRASSSIPIVAGPPVEIDGRRYIDGGMLRPLSFKSALEDGCTHVLVFSTLPVGRARFRNPVFTDLLIAAALERLRPGLGGTYRGRHERYLADYRRLAAATLRPAGPPHLFVVRVGSDHGEIHWFERRRRRLLAGARAGMEAALEALVGHSDEDWLPQDWRAG